MRPTFRCLTDAEEQERLVEPKLHIGLVALDIHQCQKSVADLQHEPVTTHPSATVRRCAGDNKPPSRAQVRERTRPVPIFPPHIRLGGGASAAGFAPDTEHPGYQLRRRMDEIRHPRGRVQQRVIRGQSAPRSEVTVRTRRARVRRGAAEIGYPGSGPAADHLGYPGLGCRRARPGAQGTQGEDGGPCQWKA